MIKVKKIKYPNHLIDILKIRNLKSSRVNSINNQKIKLKEHELWYKKFSIKKNSIFGIYKNHNFIGYITIDGSKKNYTSWYLTRKFWGKISFYKILKSKTNNGTFFAKILIDNIASQIVAIKSGFIFQKRKRNVLLFNKIKK